MKHCPPQQPLRTSINGALVCAVPVVLCNMYFILIAVFLQLIFFLNFYADTLFPSLLALSLVTDFEWSERRKEEGRVKGRERGRGRNREGKRERIRSLFSKDWYFKPWPYLSICPYQSTLQRRRERGRSVLGVHNHTQIRAHTHTHTRVHIIYL